jgi:hypothetical protein
MKKRALIKAVKENDSVHSDLAKKAMKKIKVYNPKISKERASILDKLVEGAAPVDDNRR